jgi:hypothetical protein
MRAVIVAAGFRVRAWDDVTAEVSPLASRTLQYSIQRLVMGDRLQSFNEPTRRNAEERRLVNVQAVFDRM